MDIVVNQEFNDYKEDIPDIFEMRDDLIPLINAQQRNEFQISLLDNQIIPIISNVSSSDIKQTTNDQRQIIKRKRKIGDIINTNEDSTISLVQTSKKKLDMDYNDLINLLQGGKTKKRKLMK